MHARLLPDGVLRATRGAPVCALLPGGRLGGAGRHRTRADLESAKFVLTPSCYLSEGGSPYVVYPGTEVFPLADRIRAVGIEALPDALADD